ncbi:hypothetical protein CK203_052295 [Vitis vinifera]|uniref:Uncharacterized protein n=1 Tax=Vitis vinifera TaxID=29760 RepID=A0A438FWG7_VITVI|nr:hypothetical protein CK203_052295 [Vitis vinifera]
MFGCPECYSIRSLEKKSAGRSEKCEAIEVIREEMALPKFMDFSNSRERRLCDPLLKVPSGEGKEWQGTSAHKMLLQQQMLDGDAQTLRLCHVQLEHYACLWRLPPPYGSCLFAGSASPDKDLCDGDNGYYLRTRAIEGHPYLEFASSDIGDPTVGNEAFTTHDGSVLIKSDSGGVALIGYGLTQMIPSTTTQILCFGPLELTKMWSLSATLVTTISVIDLVLTTRPAVSMSGSPQFPMRHAWRDIVMTTADAINMTQEPHTQQVKLSYTETKSRTWNGSVSVKLGVQITIESGVPFIAGVETEYNVTVPEMTRVTVSMIETQGLCDVPFYYSQRDT